MLKKGIWFVLYMAGVTAMAVSLLISLLFFKEFEFGGAVFTEDAEYHQSEQLLRDLSYEAFGIWEQYDVQEQVSPVMEITDEQIYQMAESLGIDSDVVDEFMKSTDFSSVLKQWNESMMREYMPLERQESGMYDPQKTNLRYTISYNEITIATNIPNEGTEEYESVVYIQEQEGGLVLRVFLNTKYPVADKYLQRALAYNRFQNMKWGIMGTILGSIILIFLSVVMLSRYTGRRKGRDDVVMSWIDIPPVEIAILFWAAVAAGLTVGIGFLANWCYDTETRFSVFALGGCILLAGSLSLTGYLSLVRRIKSHTLWKNSICYKVGTAIRRFTRTMMRVASVSQRLLLVSCLYFIIMLILAMAGGRHAWILMVVLSLLALAFLYRDAVSRQKILEAAKRITSGELDYQIDLQKINHLQIDVAESINQVGHGIQDAVQQSIKDERLRTDLITNVSHDIKTPLTSIINYVDLLKREEIQNEKAVGYLNILEQKSQRLKQLTEDLVEASKLSSGNVILNPEEMDFNEILQQALGEFEEKFQEKYLTIVLNRPDGRVPVLAEGRRMWRILENLFQNVYKYAMPATRVYVRLEKHEDYMLFTLKNISECLLNVEADELTERFIRGDVARTTEGSGLGLSIAKNLTTLQNGDFHINLDGDLFKVTLKFDLIA